MSDEEIATLEKKLNDTWNKNRKYTLAEIACIQRKSIRTVKNWVELGLGKERIQLKSMLDGGHRIVYGEWLIQFFIRLNSQKLEA
jgi:hypothetical protein